MKLVVILITGMGNAADRGAEGEDFGGLRGSARLSHLHHLGMPQRRHRPVPSIKCSGIGDTFFTRLKSV